MTDLATSVRLNDPVTLHMRTDFIRLNVEQTVTEALDAVRTQTQAGRVIYFYVTDDQGRLHGVVPTRRLLLNPPDARIKDIMVPNVVVIPADATVLDACEFFVMHKLLALPIVGPDRCIIGIVDVDLYTGELGDLERREESNDLFQLIGIHLSAEGQSPIGAFRQRFPWLLCNIGGGILAAFISGVFEEQLQAVVALALFIPVVLALAESVSIQSLSLTLQTLHGHRPTWRAMVVRMGRELMTGLFLGLACGVVVSGVALIWLGHWRVALCLLGGILAGVASAAVLGLTMPYLIRLLGRNPQVAAGPVALAASDMVTLLAYFGLARALL